MKATYLLSLTLLLIASHSTSLNAQNYSLKVTESHFNAGKQNYQGYSTRFTLPYKQVKKEWWRYIKAKAHIYNHKTHYTLTLPAKGDANTPVTFVSKLEKGDYRGPLLMVAPADENLNPQQSTALKKDLKFLLIDFKIEYYTTILQEQIDKQERTNRKISKDLHRLRRRNSSHTDKVAAQLEAGQRQLDALKTSLKQIK